MGRKAKQYTVQLTQNLDLLEKQRGHAYTATGGRVDVGLPKGHNAVLHESPHPVKGWRVTHEESGLRISPLPEFGEWKIAEAAVDQAKTNIAIHGITTIRALEDGVKIGETYRRKLWDYASVL